MGKSFTKTNQRVSVQCSANYPTSLVGKLSGSFPQDQPEKLRETSESSVLRKLLVVLVPEEVFVVACLEVGYEFYE